MDWQSGTKQAVAFAAGFLVRFAAPSSDGDHLGWLTLVQAVLGGFLATGLFNIQPPRGAKKQENGYFSTEENGYFSTQGNKKMTLEITLEGFVLPAEIVSVPAAFETVLSLAEKFAGGAINFLATGKVATGGFEISVQADGFPIVNGLVAAPGWFDGFASWLLARSGKTELDVSVAISV